MPSTTIVVPCYNEAERLPVEEFRRFARANSDVKFVMVDDGSRDSTLDLLKNLNAYQPRQFRLFSMPTNSGKAEAVRSGLNIALDHNADYVGFLDADLAAPLSEIPRFIEVLERRPEVRMVVGSRMHLLGHNIQRRWIRRWIALGFASVASRLLGVPIHDTQCGLKLFRVDSETRHLFAQAFQSRWIFDVEILARLIAEEGRASVRKQVYEVPLEQWSEIPGSKLKSSDFAKALIELFRIYVTYLRKPVVDSYKMPDATIPARVEEQQDTSTRRAA